ncbi:MAG: L,D-transpeptidase family protein [Planctomycetota bacterium]
MQTLKTSAIVVLMVAVMYSAFYSLTTPPEPIGPDVDELILANDDLGIDVGLPDSLQDLGISDGETQPQGDFASLPSFGSGPGEFADGASSDGDPAIGRISDQSFEVAGGNNGITMGFNEQSGVADAGNESLSMASDPSRPEETAGTPGQVIGLPPTQGKAPSFNLSAADQYASTGREFSMPAVEQATSNFSPSQQWSKDSGKTANAPEGLATEQLAVAIPSNGSSTASSSDETVRANPLFQTGPGESLTQNEESGGVSASLTDREISKQRNALGLSNAIQMADSQYAKDQKKEALSTLSLFYDTPGLNDSERDALLMRLDPLAREVVYSTAHLLEQPHRVRQNETLMQIASEYQVPWQLLANINNIDDPITVLPGTDLKVIRGPFRADVDITRNELTLFLGDLYAGRFPVAVGADPSPRPGSFTVLDKQSARTYYDSNGSPVPPGSINNPYGSMWIDLGGQMCIHGSPDNTEPTAKGCISVAGRYAGDLFGILSQGSSVTIRR